MIDLFVETMAKAYDAVIRGVCWAISISIVWVCFWTVTKLFSPVFKLMDFSR